MDRILGQYTEGREGPLVLAIAAIHGNETAGVEAIDLFTKMLEVEPITNPDFVFRGTFVGLLGNKQAYAKKQRYMSYDMNRQWKTENIERIRKTERSKLKYEDLELAEVCETLDSLVEKYNPTKVVIIDLHTTSSAGGIFAIPNDQYEESINLARGLKAPVILNILSGIQGSTLHYFNKDNYDYDITSVVFESGQHTEALAVNRAVAALTNCVALAGNVDFRHIENQHQRILSEYSRDYPAVLTIVDHFAIKDVSKFKMNEGYSNFQRITEGEELATYDGEILKASHTGRILMPLYQKQGSDGYFIVQDVIK